MSLTVGSLFAGIGGFDLAAERCGMTVKWQVEIDPFARRVLEKHWPHVKRYGDIRRVRYPAPVDVICGGFPCQDISVAGKGAGMAGSRSGLWSHMARVIRAVRPRYVVVENVSALLARGLGRVLGDLAKGGYDAEWDCIPASAVGAPHRRDRVWVVAYAKSGGQRADRRAQRQAGHADVGGADVADANSSGLEGRQRAGVPERAGEWTAGASRSPMAYTHRESLGRLAESRGQRGEWLVEPDVGRVAHGVPARVDRLRGLGNAIVPQVAEWIFRRILEAEAERIA